jgi:hypothetical protein
MLAEFAATPAAPNVVFPEHLALRSVLMKYVLGAFTSWVSKSTRSGSAQHITKLHCQSLAFGCSKIGDQRI